MLGTQEWGEVTPDLVQTVPYASEEAHCRTHWVGIPRILQVGFARKVRPGFWG